MPRPKRRARAEQQNAGGLWCPDIIYRYDGSCKVHSAEFARAGWAWPQIDQSIAPVYQVDLKACGACLPRKGQSRRLCKSG